MSRDWSHDLFALLCLALGGLFGYAYGNTGHHHPTTVTVVPRLAPALQNGCRPGFYLRETRLNSECRPLGK